MWKLRPSFELFLDPWLVVSVVVVILHLTCRLNKMESPSSSTHITSAVLRLLAPVLLVVLLPSKFTTTVTVQSVYPYLLFDLRSIFSWQASVNVMHA